MSPVEKMCAAWRAASDGDYLGWDDFGEGGIKDRERRQMRAAIEALAANISEEMIAAAGSQVVDSFGNVDAETALRAAIRAALSEPGPT